MIGSFRATELHDIPALSKFLVRIYHFDPSDFHAHPRLLEWKYLYPRTSWQGGRSYLLEKDGGIIAHCGVCPVTFCLPDGTTVKSLTMTDWAADPSFRGAGKMLFTKLMEMAPTSFIIGGTEPTRHILPRIGFRPIGDVASYSAWLRPFQEFRKRPRTARSTLRLLHGLTHPARDRSPLCEGWELIPVDRFDDSLLPILNASSRSWTTCLRTLDDLNYMLRCPGVQVRGYLLRRNKDLIGYFITAYADWEARLLDLVVNSEDSRDWRIAYALVTDAARRQTDVCRIRSMASVPILAQALVWNGYWRHYTQPVALHDPTSVLLRASPIDFQLLDGDYGY